MMVDGRATARRRPLARAGAEVPERSRGRVYDAESRTLRIRRLGRVPYAAALAEQERLVAEALDGGCEETLLLLEHDPVYTLGRGAAEADLRGAHERLGVPVFRVGRGGGVTFHGPGQLVAYPIVRLAHGGRDVHRYVRALEQVLVETCAAFGVAARAVPELTGVWVGEAKIAAIGIAVRRWIAWHGVALNVAADLRYFEQIVPCRLPGLRVTSLARVLGWEPSMTDVESAFAERFAAVFGYRPVETEDG